MNHQSLHPLYNTYRGMMRRCYSEKHYAYSRYAGKGVYVCARWHSFELFIKDMGARPSKSHTIDRIDNSGPYDPKNCRWATWEEQQNNKKNTPKIKFRGKSQTVKQWSRELGINHQTVYARIRKGMSIEKALTIPIKKEKSQLSGNLAITFRRQTMPLKQWAKVLGINYSTLHNRLRIRKMPLKKAFLMPVKKKEKHKTKKV